MRKFKKASLSAEIEHQFQQALLRTERVRISILVAIGSFLSIQAFLTELLIPREYRTIKVALNRFSLLDWAILISFATLVEIVVLVFVHRAIQKEKRLPEWLSFAGCTIELLFPSFIIWNQGPNIHPWFAVHSPFLLIYSLFIILSILRLNFWLSTWGGLVGAVSYFLVYLAITPQDRPITEYNYFYAAPMISLARAGFIFASGVLAGTIALRLRSLLTKTFLAQEEKVGILGVFGQYVSPIVAQKLISQTKDLTGDKAETREISVLFLDIRNFTKFSESKSPQEVFDFLNQLFGHLIKIVDNHGGFVNKFMGDGILAVFGAPLSHPKHAKQAFFAAQDILRKVESLNNSGEIPETRIGIGIHSGLALIGSVGSEERREYTIIGDTVNLASRIEQLTKEFQVQCLITEETWSRVKEDSEFKSLVAPLLVKPVPEFTVRGRDGTVRAFQVALA